MFQPACFREARIEVMQDMMRHHPFASVISLQNGEIMADHLPLVLHPEQSEYGQLQGHINRANPMRKALKAGADVLVIFQGPHHYVSAGWYPSKKEHEKVVPTWNYITVHARGTLALREESDWLLNHLNDLSDQHEKDRPEPWKVSDAPDDYINRMSRGIMGVEIEITALQGIWKTSQNKSDTDRQGVYEGLRQEDSDNAKAMSDHVVPSAQIS